MAADVDWTTDYDVEAWIENRFTRPLSAYALGGSRMLRAGVAADRRILIETKLATFGEHPAGLGKFTRSMFARDLRRRLTPAFTPREAAS
jgi:hypothetical protein